MLKRHGWKGGLFATGAILAIPAAKGIQASYRPKRKIKKGVKRNIYRGYITPTKGYLYGSTLDKALKKYPALRGSRKVRSLEGRYAQMYGQGVQFHKGTSGMRSQDIEKLDRDLRKIAERRRISKRRRGK